MAMLVLLSFLAALPFMKNKGSTAVITLNGEVLCEIDLDSVQEPYTIEVHGECENTVYVEKGGIKVLSATCPDKVCVNRGILSSQDPSPIVCLPNRLVIELKNSGSQDADIYTG